MSDRTLRAIYTGMVRGRARLQGSGSRVQPARAAYNDVACFAATVAGFRRDDVVLGCRNDGVLEAASPGSSLSPVANAIGRLYAAAGAAMTFAKGSERVTTAFFERHEVGGPDWLDGLRLAAELPLLLLVLPAWKGRRPSGDIGVVSRRAGVPAIAVDAADAVAVYRVVQESLVRARMGGGSALIEAVWFALDGQSMGRPTDAVETLATYLRLRRVASETWLRRLGATIGDRA